MNKRKIIIYGVNFYPAKGGTSTVVENLILQLKDKYDITIYCYKNESAADHIAGVRAIEFKKWASGSLGSLVYFFLSSLHILFFGKAALIHAHKTDCAIFIPLLKLRFKVIATSHEAPYKRDKWNALQKSYFRLAEKVFIQSPSVCTSISRPLADYYQKAYRREVIFIPNGINPTYPEKYNYENLKNFLHNGATLDKPFILFSARRIMSTKGGHTLLEALKRINYKGQVFISGEMTEGAYMDKLRSLSEGLNVHFLGFVEPLNTLLALVSCAQFFVFPSETEGMSIMLLEVASTGKPIIASDIPENTQVFSGEQVLYFKCGDSGDLAGKIQFALSDQNVMARFGENAQREVYTNYLWTEIALEYSLLYEKVVVVNK